MDHMLDKHFSSGGKKINTKKKYTCSRSRLRVCSHLCHQGAPTTSVGGSGFFWKDAMDTRLEQNKNHLYYYLMFMGPEWTVDHCSIVFVLRSYHRIM